MAADGFVSIALKQQRIRHMVGFKILACYFMIKFKSESFLVVDSNKNWQFALMFSELRSFTNERDSKQTPVGATNQSASYSFRARGELAGALSIDTPASSLVLLVD